MNGIVVEKVDGLRRSTGAYGIALVWENRIVVDSNLGMKHPRFREYVLWHEWQHIRLVRKYGMSRAFRIRSRLFDSATYGISLGLGHIFFYWLSRRAKGKER